VLLDDGARKYVWGATGLAYNVASAGGAVEVYHRDHLGNVRALTDAGEQVTTIYVTDEYGVPSIKEAPAGQTANDQPFEYAGELLDADAGTNLVCLRVCRICSCASGPPLHRMQRGAGGVPLPARRHNRRYRRRQRHGGARRRGE
jgi:hypothetical protein